MLKSKLFFITVLIILSITSLVFADIPEIITYQGKLTDIDGIPVDESKLIKFIIYDADVDGNILWNSQFQTVPVSNGLFSISLGQTPAMDPLPTSIFSSGYVRYLGITVGTDDEMAPRTQLTSEAYAYHALNADNAGSLEGLVAAEFSLAAHNHDGLYPPLVHYHEGVYANFTHTHSGYASTSHTHSNYSLTTHSHSYASVTHNHSATDITSGTLSTSRYDAYNDLSISGRLDNTASTDILTRAQLDGRYSPSPLNVSNIGNEMGMAESRNTGCVSITSITDMIDIVTVTISIPSAGYIHLEGNGFAELYGTTGVNRIKAQIDETSGGYSISGYYTRAGLGGYVNTTFSDFDFTCVRTYYKSSAGTYTFRLEVLRDVNSGTTRICFTTLTAFFIPTEYGDVSTVASGGSQPKTDLQNISTIDNKAASSGDIITNEILLEKIQTLEAKIEKLEE